MPKIIDIEKKRSKIARAAIELFARKGFEQTTIQEIASAAEIGKGTVYHYFKDKDEILRAASEELMGALETPVEDLMQKIKDPAEVLSSMFYGLLNITDDAERIFTIYLELWLLSLRNRVYWKHMRPLQDMLIKWRATVAEIIRQGKKQKLFRKDIDPEAAAISIVASLDGIGMHYLFDKKKFDMNKVAREFAESVIKGLKREGK
jgi:AcrR family transcriptional regulator